MAEVRNNIISSLGTGFRELDKHVNFLAPGLHVIGGWQGTGKTDLVDQMAEQFAKQDIAVVLFKWQSDYNYYQQKARDTARAMAAENIATAIPSDTILYTAFLDDDDDNWDDDLSDEEKRIWGYIQNHPRIVEPWITRDKESLYMPVRMAVEKTRYRESGRKVVVMIDSIDKARSTKRGQNTDEDFDNVIVEMDRIADEMAVPIILTTMLYPRERLCSAGLADFKGLGRLEACARSIFALQPACLSNNEYLERNRYGDGMTYTLSRALKFGDQKKMELKCLKNCQGDVNFSVYLNFYCQFGYYEEAIRNDGWN